MYHTILGLLLKTVYHTTGGIYSLYIVLVISPIYLFSRKQLWNLKRVYLKVLLELWGNRSSTKNKEIKVKSVMFTFELKIV